MEVAKQINGENHYGQQNQTARLHAQGLAGRRFSWLGLRSWVHSTILNLQYRGGMDELAAQFPWRSFAPPDRRGRLSLHEPEAPRATRDATLTLVAMSPTPSTGAIVRFGIYEANLAAGELRKNGAKIRLQEQPFQVLAVLLERPGEVVAREELRTRVWNAETFVDFDHSLNTAINKLRDALDDSAANPRFVETLAKRGYRFIAPVQFPALFEDRRAPNDLAKPSDTAARAPSGDLPEVNRAWVRFLFGLIQIMYLVFYVLALIRLDEVGITAGMNLAPLRGETITAVVLLTAAVGIPLRLYSLSGVAFDHGRLGERFLRIFPGVILLDLLWALAPFLILHIIGVGAAVAATAALLYVPFGERTLIRMAYSNFPANG
jgi:DNA-binding winged helix-turn-helix (wHTH) protein